MEFSIVIKAWAFSDPLQTISCTLKRMPDVLTLATKYCAQATRYSHGLMIFDHEGCGHENEPVADVESIVRHHLHNSGWGDRAEVVVIEPELEAWVWSDSPHVEEVLGWSNQIPSLRAWLTDRHLLAPRATKPSRPKEAMQAAIRQTGVPRHHPSIESSRSGSVWNGVRTILF